MTQTVLILGATGKFGRHTAAAFEARGWTVRRFNRGTDDLTRAAQGAEVIVMGWNPPTYATWDRDLLPMHRQVIAAARTTGATVILPGNVYVYGPDSPELWTDTTPKRATNPLGLLRIEMEEMYRASGVQTILLRCGDFIDDRASGNWFDAYVAKRATKGSIAYPGPLDVPHAWAYLPDVGRAAVMLAETRDRLSRFEDVPFEGYTLTGRALAAAIARGLGREVRAGRFAWWPLVPMRLVMPMLKGVFEMRYLWSKPQRLDGTKLARLCPDFVPTPVETAMVHALAHQSRTPRSAVALA